MPGSKPDSAQSRASGLWALRLLMLPQLLLAAFLIYTVVRAVLSLLGVLPAQGPREEGLDRASVAVIPIGIFVATGMLATAIGLFKARSTAFYIAAVSAFLLGSVGVVIAGRGGPWGFVLLLAALILGGLHALAWPVVRDAQEETIDEDQED